MPKIHLPQLPLSGVFAVAKPSGPTSMSVVNSIKPFIISSRLFVDQAKLGQPNSGKRGKRARDAVKIGQGGTLDPLADGVLVIGIGKATKKLGELLDGVKEYRTTCLLGCETDSYDREGACVRLAPWRHVTSKMVEQALTKFRGEIEQTPPVFSALKMDGMPLYDYARKGIPLPRPIEKRKITVHSLKLVEWIGTNHNFTWPEKKISAEERAAMVKALHTFETDFQVEDELQPLEPDEVATAFVLEMNVSGGTYVRSIVHDLGHAVGSAGHVVTLTRTRQSRFTLNPVEESDKGCVPWEVFSRALTDIGDKDEDGLVEWEREVLNKLDVFEAKSG